MASTTADGGQAAPPAGRLMLPASIERCLPAMVRTELAALSASQQTEFLEEFQRKRKGLSLAYLCSLLYCHYGFVGRWGTTVMMWLVALVTLGVGGIIWWFIDLFRMPGIVRNYNRDVALEVLRNMKAIQG